MDYKELARKIFEAGQLKMDEMEVFIQKNKEFEIEVFEGKVDKYSISESGGLSLRGLADGKMGYSYTEKIDESSIDMLVEEAYENGKYIDSIDKEDIFSSSNKYEDVKAYSNEIGKISVDDKINFLKLLEKEALGLDNRVTSVQGTAYKEIEQERYIMNTKGIELSDQFNGGYSYTSVIAKDGDDVKTGMSIRMFKDFTELNYKEMAKEAVHRATSMLGARSIKSDDYPVIIENRIFADIISAFSPIFTGENVQKGLSLLKDKVGTNIASDLLTIIDDPFLKDGFATRAFDDEGTPTRVNKIIDKGVLNTYLHNWKTAEKDGVESTGHASRSSYKSSLSISPSNLYIEEGNKTLEELIGSIEKGLFIVEVAGLHSGLNSVSGDFSLSASGYEILNGKIGRPVNLITIAGNLYEVFNNIEDIADDLKFTLGASGYIGSPSVKLKSLSVAGEQYE